MHLLLTTWTNLTKSSAQKRQQLQLELKRPNLKIFVTLYWNSERKLFSVSTVTFHYKTEPLKPMFNNTIEKVSSLVTPATAHNLSTPIYCSFQLMYCPSLLIIAIAKFLAFFCTPSLLITKQTKKFNHTSVLIIHRHFDNMVKNNHIKAICTNAIKLQ